MRARVVSGAASHPVTRTAVAAAVGQVRSRLGAAPADLAFVFLGDRHAAAIEEAVDAVAAGLAPAALLGSAAPSVIGDGRALGGTGVGVWAAHFDGGTAAAVHVAGNEPERIVERLRRHGPVSSAILLADPYSFPTDRVLELFNRLLPGVPVLGGQSAVRGPGGAPVLFTGDGVAAEGGAVCAWLDGVEVLPFVGLGTTPVGPALRVTRADRHLVRELAGRPAFDVLDAVVSSLGVDERAQLEDGMWLGIADEQDGERRGETSWRTRHIVAFDRQARTIAVGGTLRAGQSIQLHANSAAIAEANLRRGMDLCRQALHGRAPAGVLLFTCAERGQAFPDAAAHDIAVVSAALSGPPIAGLALGGEIGPLADGLHVHGMSTVAAVFPAG